MTLKYKLGVTQGHWKWHHSIDSNASSYRHCLVSFPRQSEILVSNSDFSYPICIWRSC